MVGGHVGSASPGSLTVLPMLRGRVAEQRWVRVAHAVQDLRRRHARLVQAGCATRRAALHPEQKAVLLAIRAEYPPSAPARLRP